MIRPLLRLAATALLALCLTLPLAPGASADEVVVVLDTSGSMDTTDPDRLSILSTLILSDLLRRGEDDLAFIPFDRALGSPSDANGEKPIRWSDSSDTDAFRDRVLSRLDFDGLTFFSPPLVSALDSLQGRKGRKVIILLTDGNSSSPAEDQARIERDVLPRAREEDVDIWVVGLGPRPSQAALPRFFQARRQGGFEEAQTAQDLPEVFAQVLAKALGRKVEVQELRGGGKLPFDARPSVAQLDMVAIGSGHIGQQQITLTDPSGTPWAGATGDNMGGSVTATDAQGNPRAAHSYRRIRLASPATGRWTLRSAPPTRLLLVRRFRYEVQLTAAGGHSQVPAGHNICLEAQVLSKAGATSKAAPVTNPVDLVGLELRLLEFDSSDPTTPTYDPQPMRDDGATPDDPIANDGSYGWCHGARPDEVGTRILARSELSSAGVPYTESNEISFEVVEAMGLKPAPASLSFGATTALETGDEAECEAFKIAPPDSQLPSGQVPFDLALEHDDSGKREPGLPGDGALRNATVTIDGDPLTGSLAAGTVHASWSIQQPDHEVCVQAGHRYAGGSGEVFLVVTPSQAVYADFGITGEIRLRITTAAPGFLETWGGVLAVLGLLLVGIVIFLATRHKPLLPQGLAIACWQGDPDRPSRELNWQPCGGEREFHHVPTGLKLQRAKRGVVISCEREVRVRGADGRWRPVEPTGDGGLPLSAAHTYRIGDSYLRLGEP